MKHQSHRLCLYLAIFGLIEKGKNQQEKWETRENNSGNIFVLSNNTADDAIGDYLLTSLLSTIDESFSPVNETETVYKTSENETIYSIIPETTVRVDGVVVNKPRVAIPPLTYQLDVSKSNRYLSQDVTDFACSSDSYCNGSLSRHTGLCTTDCMPCQCDEQCHFYGDCCPDVAFQDSPDRSSVSFPYLICTIQKWTTWLNSSNIFMVGKCPPHSDPTIVQKCEFPDITIQIEATPVSDFESNITYRNSFCAKCHALKDYGIWKHEVVCSLLSSIQFATSKADLWRIVVKDRDCEITTKPPDFVSLRECYPVTHNTCNGSGNAKVKTLCQMYSHPIHYYGPISTFSSYRNVFCALCDGAILDPSMPCTRVKSPSIPFPLNVLLDFNPPTERVVQKTTCEIGQVADLFSNTCVNISCPLRRYVVDNHCEDIFTSANGLGMSMDAILKTVDPTVAGVTNGGFLTQYSSMLHESLQPFSPFAVSIISARFYTSNPGHVLLGPAELIQIQAAIISKATRSLTELETTLLNLTTGNFTYQAVNNRSIDFRSVPILCQKKNMVPQQYEEVVFLREMYMTHLSTLDPRCAYFNCLENILFESVPLKCPFVEYDLSLANFTYFSHNHSILFNEHVLNLAPFRHLECEGFLQICTDELDNISKTLSQETTPDPNLALSIVSLVCMSLSLAGLVLTFITYGLIPKLRTLPGKNTMALVFNLFLAQVLFLTTSNRTSNIVLCQIFGVLIHYFWLSSFAWMSMSAYHMFTVFTNLSANLDNRNDRKRFVRYALISNLLPILIIAVCLAVFFAQSKGIDSGYGGRVCFLNNPIAIGGFFAAPLGLMLLLNIFFFGRTIHAISSVPDMKTSTNQNNKLHMFVYIKLSLLFGFSWTFGILAEIIRSDELTYVFVVLSGSQGLMLFIAYCLNKRTWSELRSRFGSTSSKYNTSNQFTGPPTMSPRTKSTVVNSHSS